MRLEGYILGTIGIVAAAFVIWMLIGLANHQGHTPSRVDNKVADAEPSGPSVSEEPQPGPTRPGDVASVNLHRLLMRLHRTSQPFRRREIFDQARLRRDEFEDPLLIILGEQADPLVVPAIDMAAGLDLQSAAVLVLLLADGDRVPVRIAAIRAREHLDPWTASELEGLLKQESDVNVLRLVLQIVASRPDRHRPVAQLVRLLRHDRALVRNAAVAAIPRSIAGKHLDALCDLATATDTKPTVRRTAARALGQTTLAPVVEDCLMTLLSSEDWVVRKRALEALSNKTTRLRNAEPILAIVRDRRRSPRERAFGFIAFERTGTLPSEAIKKMLPDLHPVMQMFAARCLLCDGDRAAIPVLIDLLDTTKSDSVDTDERMCVRRQSRRMLAEISGEDFGPKSEPWRRWYRKNRTLSVGRPKVPPPKYW